MALAVESVARGSLLIPAGYLADRFGPYRVILAAWLLGAAGPLLMVPAQTWQWAIPGMAVYAISAFALPSVSAYVLLSLPDKTVPGINERALTAIFAAYPAGLIVSPTLGGLIAEASSIRACLWIAAGLFALSTLVVLLAKHVPPVAVQHGERPGDLLHNRRYRTVAAFYSVAAFVYLIGYMLAPNFLQDTRGFSYGSIGLLFSLMALGTVGLNLVIGRLAGRWGYALALGIVWLATGLLWQARSLLPAGIAFLGLGATWSARVLALAGVSAVVPPRSRGLAFGVADTVYSAAIAGAAWAAGALYSRTPAHDLPLLAGLVGIPAMLALWALAIRPLLHPAGAAVDAAALAASGE
jgi:predicted MFS family arabinose efflux permease